ncbi:MAG TPA: phage major capsid protein [Verrucomicrobiae bacterium]|nr:phage major capsid protein [Verrucomicrobiae bacterium]
MNKQKIGMIGLALLAALAVGTWALDASWLAPAVALAAAPLVLTEGQVAEFQGILGDLKSGWAELKPLPATCRTLQTETARLEQHLAEVRRLLLTRALQPGRARVPGLVSDACASEVAARFIAHCAKSDMLEALCSAPAQRDALAEFARGTLNLSTRAALTTGDIPLPAQYGSELRELISEFGVVRRRMSLYPIGMGTAKPARMGARAAFSSIAMSGAFGEKSPAYSFASLESHKIGGIVRLPRELDEQSIVALGQFLARYGAVEFARAEDTWGFLGDGSVNYDMVKGIVQVARDTLRTQALAAGKTKPSDATLDDFRSLRTKVNKAALNGRLSAYYLDSTWETRLPSFRSAGEPNVYQRLPDGSALLDGYPIVWTDVLEPYGTAASADKPLAVFGALSFWWLGEHGTPRIDTSEHVWFANDQLAVRFIEEIDFDYAANDATAALLTAAA